jgi:hypothetical protein
MSEIVHRRAQNSGDKPQQGFDTKTDILNDRLTVGRKTILPSSFQKAN